jgi:hypothetical protein
MNLPRVFALSLSHTQHVYREVSVQAAQDHELAFLSLYQKAVVQPFFNQYPRERNVC